MSAPSPRPWRPDLDGLRALAVGAVLVHHVAPAAWPGGFAGVDVFFVLSGFLITGILADASDAGAFSWVAFLDRRARRLLPALVVVLAATTALGAATLTAPEFVALARQLVAAGLSAANLLFRRDVGYFDAAADTKPLLHLWSLGVEEQFYLAWPPLLVVLARIRRRRTLVAAALLVASAAIALRLASRDPGAAFYLLHARAWELLAGGVLALAQRDGLAVQPSARVAALLSWIGAATIGAGLVLPSPDATWPGALTALPVLGTVVVIAAGPAAPLNRTVLAWRAMTWLGRRSYPLYLWHWPLLAFLRLLAPDFALDDASVTRIAWLVGALSIALADLTYRHVELPWQRRDAARAATRAPTVAALRPAALALAAIVTIGAAILALDGLPRRYARTARDEGAILARASRDRVQRAVEQGAVRCVGADETWRTSWCLRRGGEAARIAVFGDSHAEALFAALGRALPHEGLLLVGRPGCAPAIHPDTAERDAPMARNRARCRGAVRRAHELLARERGVHTVLLAARGAYQVEGTPFGRETGLPILPIAHDSTRPDTAALAARWEAGMARTIARLHRDGRRVIVVLDWPELGFDPRRCIAGRPFGLRPVLAPCAVPRAVVDRRTASYRAAVARLVARFPGVTLYDAAAPLCDAVRCTALAGDTLLYHDDDHLSLAGAERAFAPLAASLAVRPLVAWRRADAPRVASMHADAR